MGECRGVYKVLVGKPEGKKTLGRPRRRWEDNIKMDLQEVGCGVVDWIELWFSRRTLLHGVNGVYRGFLFLVWKAPRFCHWFKCQHGDHKENFILPLKVPGC
jgi:hypothetical protein